MNFVWAAGAYLRVVLVLIPQQIGNASTNETIVSTSFSLYRRAAGGSGLTLKNSSTSFKSFSVVKLLKA